MARPVSNPPGTVYRVWLSRPERKDSQVKWLTMDIDKIREKYGKKVLRIDRYGHERSFNA
jgi:hypothetical protein